MKVDEGSHLLVCQDKKCSFEDLIDRLHKRALANLWDNSNKRTTVSLAGVTYGSFYLFLT